ncbi:glycosyl hydrolase family 8 [Pseudorhizobium marinum]|uniref:glycosyl hydrolase family 8 n=1 Tax=Pseudorhizobium marinum TaxID=1496690 RepID=UPI000B234754|nr:glycosyl hydrolase family 8 [Pseudorhizobium marinum]
MIAKPLISMLTLLGLLAATGPAAAQQGSIGPSLWQDYTSRFLDASGRIVDNANGGISHSEGQGYGLLLAFFANSPSDFEQIWSFTKTELMIRDDGLTAWKWDPGAQPHVTDVNNASDGDLLIAYALAMAGAAWEREDYLASAAALAHAILDNVVVESGGRVLLLPAAEGFDAGERTDGPVINPSYWIFESFPIMAILAPSDRWSRLQQDGLALIAQMQFGPRQLPAEWVSLARQPKPAEGFAAEFGYNAIRIPLYLLRASLEHIELAKRMLQAMTINGTPAIIDLPSGQAKERLEDPGYQFVNHILACVGEGRAVPVAARELTSQLYYPATLHLLGLAYIVEKHPSCL